MSVGLLQLTDKLYQAVNDGKVNNVIDLIKKGANVNLMSSNGRTPLGRASELGSLEIVRVLLDADKITPSPVPQDDVGKVVCPLAVIYNAVRNDFKEQNKQSPSGGDNTQKEVVSKFDNENKLPSIQNSVKSLGGAISKKQVKLKPKTNSRQVDSYGMQFSCGCSYERTSRNAKKLDLNKLDSTNQSSLSSFESNGDSESDNDSNHDCKCCPAAMASHFSCNAHCPDSSSTYCNTSSSTTSTFCQVESDSEVPIKTERLHPTNTVQNCCDKENDNRKVNFFVTDIDTNEKYHFACCGNKKFRSSLNTTVNIERQDHAGESSGVALSTVENTSSSLANNIERNNCSLDMSTKSNSYDNASAVSSVIPEDSNKVPPLAVATTVTKEFQHKQPNIGYYVMEHEDKSTSASSASKSPDSGSCSCCCHHRDKNSMAYEEPSSFETKRIRRCRLRLRSRKRASTKEAPTVNISDADHKEQQDEALNERISWSMSMWHNSKWGEELRGEYESVGMPWPWTHRVAEPCWYDVVDRNGCTPLQYAAYNGHQSIVEALLKAGADPDRVNAEELSALHIATDRHFVSVVQTLIQYGASVNSKIPMAKTPVLHIAATRGYDDIIKILLENGANVDGLDSKARTAITRAAYSGHTSTVKLLLENNASVNVQFTRGANSLCEAVWKKDVEMVRMLLEAGATAPYSNNLLTYATDKNCQEIMELLLEQGWPINKRDDNGYTPLMYAAKNVKPDLVKILLDRGADPDVRSTVSCTTALHELVLAIANEDEVEFKSIFHMLLNAGASLNASAQLKGDTPMFRSILLEKPMVVRVLLMQGADVLVNNSCMMGVEMIRLAVFRNNRDFCLLLVLAGVSLYPCTWLTGPPAMLGNEVLHKMLLRIRSEPLRLADLCRIAIRRSLRGKVPQRVSALPVPPLIRRFLLLVGDETRLDLIEGS